jgi:metacaspase-1
MVKRALLVAINSYPDAPLSGCLNDLSLTYKILKEIYGFTEFAILDNEKATKKNWITTLTNLGRRSKPGDWLVNMYSGHGSQLPCTTETSNFEQDGMDEIVIPYDHDWDDPFRDDDFNNIIKSISTEVKMYFQYDCCFSGTILRNKAPEKNGHPIKSRYLPPPLHMVLESGEMELDEELNLSTSRKRKDKMMLKPFMKDTTTQGNAILISGCSDKQTSADAWMSTSSGKGRYHGAMTYYLAQTLREANWKITYAKLVEIMNQKLHKDGFEQSPQLECHRDFMDKNFLE